MNIVFKNSFKNIFCKPFRTLLVVFAIFVCSLCALLCFDLSESITTVLTGYMGNISRADFIVIATGSDVSTLPDGFPEADTMTIVGDNEMLYKKIDGEYCYVTTDSLRIFGLNVDEAVDMNFIAPIDIKDDEIYLTTKFAEDFGPMDPDCNCYACTNFTSAYVRHLIKANEMFGLRLCTYHNIHYLLDLIPGHIISKVNI